MKRLNILFFTKILLIIFIFIISVNHLCEAGKRYKIVILPFEDNTQMGLAETVPDILRSLVTQTGYFEAVERNKIYEMAAAIVPSDAIKIDDIKSDGDSWTADQVDLFSSLDVKRVQKFSKRLKAKYAVKGSISQIGSSFRIDAEMIEVRTKKSLGFVSVEGGPEQLSTGIVKELSDKMTSFCRSLNAYVDALHIISMYNQGQYTFDVTEKKLKDLIAISQDEVGIHAVLMVLYLSEIRSGGDNSLEDKVVESGEVIINLLDKNYDEKVLEIFLTSGFDPFDEMAKIYSGKDNITKAIETYQKAVSIYPINIGGHYKELGMLYLKENLEDKAIQAFERSLRANKGSYELHFLLASIFEKRSSYDKAREHLEECVKYARNAEEIEAAKEKINNIATQIN